jgi:hypothetical protein
MSIKPPHSQARISAARRKNHPGTDFARGRTKIQQEKVRKAQSRTAKRNPDFGVCGVFQRSFTRSGAGRPVRGSRLSRGIPTLGCTAFSNVFFARSGAGTPTPRTISCTCFSVPRRAKHARNHLNGRRQCLLHRQKRKQRTKKDRK